MKVLGLMRVRNEDRWLERCLDAQHFCEKIIVLDDNSTDRTAEIAQSYSKVEYHLKTYNHGYDEGPDREYLAYLAAAYQPEWICSMDGDEELLPFTYSRIAILLDDKKVPAIEFLNINLWNDEQTVRFDGPFYESYRQRLWRFIPGRLTYEKDHCSIPNELTARPFARCGVGLLHYGAMHAADRLRRYTRYKNMGHDWPVNIQGDPGGPEAGDMKLVPLSCILQTLNAPSQS